MQRPADKAAETIGWLEAARSHGLLSRLPDATVASLIRGAQRVEYPAGAVLLRWDDTPRTAIVLRGSFRSYITNRDGNQVTTRYLQPGDITGVFAPRQPRLARAVQAMEVGELLLIDAERVREIALSDPKFGWALIEEMTTVLNGVQRGLYIRAFGSVRQRIVSALVDHARIAGQLRVGGRVAGTQSEVALEVGTAREVVASTLAALKDDGLVEVHRGAVVLLDPNRLAREAESVVSAAA